MRWLRTTRAITTRPTISNMSGPNHSATLRPDSGGARRLVEHEITVAADHVGANVVVAGAVLEHPANLLAQIHRELGVGIADGLVLAHQAAQLLGDGLVARLQHRVVHLLGVDGEDRGRKRECGAKYQRPHYLPSIASTRSRNSRCQVW